MRRIDGSFRDQSGQVFDAGDAIVRSVNPEFREHWQYGIDSGFLEDAVSCGRLVSFGEIEPLPGSWKSLKTDKIPFVSYPYEWCFSQLKDAAVLTLRLQLAALAKGMVLKDASAYNILYSGPRPVFIDLLSFEKWTEGEPWKAYRQFCTHFLAPLAVMSRVDLRCGFLSRLWMDGIPLDLAVKMLPWRSRFSLGLGIHLFLHAKMQGKHGNARKSAEKAARAKVSGKALTRIAEDLLATVWSIKPPAASTEWGDYYNDTNYSDEAASFKLRTVQRVAKETGGGLALDMGANTGRYSKILSDSFRVVLAPDIDPLAVEKHYGHLRQNGPENIVPLVLDLGNPTPGLGWANSERHSFGDRCQADMLNALALIHHLVMTAGIPMPMVADYFASLLKSHGILILEFVPKSDSQVQRMLAARTDVFGDYDEASLMVAFGTQFRRMARHSIPQSQRTLHVFQKI